MKNSQSPRAKPEGPSKGPVDMVEMVDMGGLNSNIIIFINREYEINVPVVRLLTYFRGPFTLRRNTC